jgi:radical SAM superfamily enzyme YgiQ (UPF0313 family)
LIKQKTVSLIYPCLRDNGFGNLGRHPGNCYIPHGLPQLAACLNQEGYDVNLLDFRDVEGWSQVEAWIRSDNAEVYGITCPTLDYYEAVKTAQLIKQVKPAAKVIVGGPHPSIMPQETAQEHAFDYVVAGEGEVTFPMMLENLEACPKIIHAVHPDLDKLPYEKREIFNLKKIFKTKHPVFKQPTVSVMCGRGCLYNCTFCQPAEKKIFGKFRMRSLDHFFGEIEMLNRTYNFNTLIIDDDSFTLKPDYTAAFCERYSKIKKPFVCQSRVDFICNNEDLIKRLHECGLVMMNVGFESGNQRILDFLGKGTTVEQNLEAGRILHKYKIGIFANHMIGIPTETKEEVLDTLRMIRKIAPEYPALAFFTPSYGSYLYDYCKTNNLLLSDDPVLLGRRNPTEPKIKGVDYEWLTLQLNSPRTRLHSLVPTAIKNRIPNRIKRRIRKIA